MSVVVTIAAMDRRALVQCLGTLHPELRKQVLVIDNTDKGLGVPGVRVHRPAGHTHIRDYRPRRNIGVARAMNLGACHMQEQGLAGVLWLSTSMRFAKDGGMRLVEAALASDAWATCAEPGQLHALVIRAEGFEQVGLWDENFFPGYHEDTDWRYRLGLAGGRLNIEQLPGDRVRDGHGFDCLRSANPGIAPINFDALKAYYTSKWGGLHGEERFTHPFNGPALPITYWPEVTREELIERYGLGL